MLLELRFRFTQFIRRINRLRLKMRHHRKSLNYIDWIDKYESVISRTIASTSVSKVTIAVVIKGNTLSTYDDWLASLQSLQAPAQVAIHAWCIDCNFMASLTKDQIINRLVKLHIYDDSKFPTELEWLMQLQAGDVLASTGLTKLLLSAQNNPQAVFVYADHDHLDDHGARCEPWFKPDWDWDLHAATAYASDACIVRRSLLGQITPKDLDIDALLLCSASQKMDRQTPVAHESGIVLHKRAFVSASEAIAAIHQRENKVANLVQQTKQSHGNISVSATNWGLRLHWPAPEEWPLVTIVIPTRNQLLLLQNCLASLEARKTDYPNLQIIVVDNGSDDKETLEFLSAWSKKSGRFVLRDDGPFNYSALNNRAIQSLALGEIIALVNNDIEAIYPDWLKEMVTQAIRPNVGCVGARLLYSDNSIQHGGIILGINKNWKREVAGAAHAFKAISIQEPGYMGRAQVAQSFSAVTAACLVVRKDIYLQVGGLDERNLAVTYNDVDFCLRVGEAGYLNIWTPYATLYHHESISRGKDSEKKNRSRFMREAAYFNKRWKSKLANDPAYNSFLSLEHAMFNLSCPPRLELFRHNDVYLD